MEAIKVPERRRNMWQTWPAKFNFCRARLAKQRAEILSGAVSTVAVMWWKYSLWKEVWKENKEAVSFWSNLHWGWNDLMCWLNIVFVWSISRNWCVKSMFINPSSTLKAAKVTRNTTHHQERAQSYHSLYFLWAVCVYTAARRCLKSGHHKVSVHIYIMMEDVFGTMTCYKQTSLLNIYAKLNERPVQRRNICASIERARDREREREEIEKRWDSRGFSAFR